MLPVDLLCFRLDKLRYHYFPYSEARIRVIWDSKYREVCYCCLFSVFCLCISGHDEMHCFPYFFHTFAMPSPAPSARALELALKLPLAFPSSYPCSAAFWVARDNDKRNKPNSVSSRAADAPHTQQEQQREGPGWVLRLWQSQLFFGIKASYIGSMGPLPAFCIKTPCSLALPLMTPLAASPG